MNYASHKIDVIATYSFLEYVFVLKKYSILISTLVSADMDFTQLDAFLSSQMKKRQVCIERD